MSTHNDLISIRELNDDEWPVYAALRLEALTDSPHNFGSRLDIEEQFTPQQWRDWLKPYRVAIFALFDNDMPIGLSLLSTDRTDPSTGHFIASYIKPAYRNRRLSHVLYTARIEWSLNHLEWNRVVTCYREGNQASCCANQYFGFKVYHITRNHLWEDGTYGDKFDSELNLENIRHNKSTFKAGTTLSRNNRG